jgi:hypothetical protein
VVVQIFGQLGTRRHVVDRHAAARFVDRASEFVVDADRQDRKIIEEEGVVVVGVEPKDDVGLGGDQRLAGAGKHPPGLGGRAFLDNLRRIKRRVRQAVCSHYFRQFTATRRWNALVLFVTASLTSGIVCG